jgi:hypothetical protein
MAFWGQLLWPNPSLQNRQCLPAQSPLFAGRGRSALVQTLKPWIIILEGRQLHDLAIRGAIMRKLLHIAFGILRHQQPFNPTLVFMPKTV